MGRPRKSAQAAHENITVLDVKPIRTLAPMFPAPQGFHTYTPPNNPSFVCVAPYGSTNAESGANPPGFTSGQMPPSAFFMGASAPQVLKSPKSRKTVLNPTPVQMKSPSMTPVSTGQVKKRRGRKRKSELITSDIVNLAATPIGTTSISPVKVGTSTSVKRGRGRPRKDQTLSKPTPKKQKEKVSGEITLVPFSVSPNPREAVEEVLMTFDALRRRILQLDEADQVKNAQHLKAGSIMISNDLRVNRAKTVGRLPGVEVGDMYFFRIEMCLVGVNTQTVAGIDYTKGEGEDRLAVSIVSSGMYENADDDADTLIYSGQGMPTKNDQKLVKGNLALENSLKRGNEVRVVRSVKDHSNPPNGKIYVYDGLYKIQHSWTEKAGSGYNVFKYKLLREPGQPAAISLWRKAENWCVNPSSRGDVVVADISAGKESRPVCLVNEVDEEKGQPDQFTYTNELTYKAGINPTKNTEGCVCATVCLPGDTNCLCAIKNGGHPPYSAQGVLVRRKPMLYECGGSCGCGISCRSRLTQKGVQLRFEVFKTPDRGWGLRCWEPIRSGTFICEFTGEVMDSSALASTETQDDEYLFRPLYNDQSFKWNQGPQLLGDSPDDPVEAAKKLNFVISAKTMGNMSRFINHSCSPNLFWQPVVHDHTDEGRPHVAFFAMKHIPPMTELTYDYGLSEGDGAKRKKTCLCRSQKCKGTFG